MAEKVCPSASRMLGKEAGRAVLPTPDGPDQNRTLEGGSKVANESQYGDSARQDNSGKPQLTKCDLIERAAIVAEGNDWPHDKAERTVAWWNGFSTFGQALGAAK